MKSGERGWMDRTRAGMVCGGLCVATLLVWRVMQSNATAVRPQSVVVRSDPQSVDLDRIEQGIYDAHFELTNTSQKTVLLSSPTTSCGCIRAELSTQRLEPEEVCTVDASLNLAGYRDRIQVEVIVSFSEEPPGSVGILRLPIKAIVLGPYDWEPQILDFALQGSSEDRVRISPNNSKPVTVEAVETSHKAFSARIAENGKEFVVSYDSSAWTGEACWLGQHNVLVKVSDVRQPEFSVPIVVRP